MPEAKVDQVMRAILDALTERDFVRARNYLSDNRFSHISPLTTFNVADACIF